MKYKCIIVDDEPYAREILKDYSGRTECLDLVALFSKPAEAMSFLTTNCVDLAFLDINMPEIDGLTLMRSLENPPAVIFTTAHREYAIDGFELRAVDYLLKPVSFERFLKAVNHFHALRSKQTAEMGTDSTPQEREKFILVRENKKTHRIMFNSILYIESYGEYLRFYTDSKRVMTLGSLVNLERSLPGDMFHRIHNSYIINLSKLNSYTSYSADIGNKELPVSRKYKHAFLEKIEKCH